MKKRRLLTLIFCSTIILLFTIAYQNISLKRSSLLGKYEQLAINNNIGQTGSHTLKNATFLLAAGALAASFAAIAEDITVTGPMYTVVTMAIARSVPTPENSIVNQSRIAKEMVLSKLD